MPRLHNAIHDLIHFLPDATFAIDKDGVVFAWNHAMEEMTGISSEEMIGEGGYAYAVPVYGEQRPILIDFFALQDSDLTRQYDHLTVTDTCIEGEMTSVRLQGAIRTLRERAAPLLDEEGQYTGAVETIRDITEETSDKKSLQRSEELNRLIFAAIPDILIRCDRTGRYLDILTPDDERFVLHGDELIGKTITEVTSGDTGHQMMEAITTSLRTGRMETIEYTLPRPDGEHHFEARIVPYLNDEVILLIRDVTGQKEAEKTLKQSEERYRSISTVITDVAYSCIQEGGGEFRIDWITGAIQQITGYEHEEMIALGCWGFLVHPDDRDIFEDQILSLPEGESSESDLRIIHKQGDLRWLKAVTECVPDETGRSRIYGGCRDITEEKTARLELELNQSRLDSAMEAGEIAWWEMDCPSGAVLFSPRKAGMLGHSPEQFAHYTDFTTLLHPDDYDTAMQAMRDHLEGRDPRYDVEYRIRASDGEYLWFRDVGGVSERNPDGTPLKVVGLVTNITRRKHDEALIRETGEQYRTLFEEAQNPILVADVGGRYVDGNQAALAFLECNRDELRTKHFWGYVPPDQLERVRDEHNPFVERRTVETTYLVHGSLKTLLLNVVPLEMGEETLLYGIGQDITERKKAELALQESEERFRTLFMDSPVSIIIHDQDSGEIIDANPKACAMYGLSSVEELNKEEIWMEPPYSFEDARTWIWKAASEGPQEFEWLSRAVTGDLYWEHVRLIPVIISRLRRILAASIDITDRKLAEEELRKSEALLRTAGRMARFGGWEVSLIENRMTWSEEVARIHGMEAGYAPSVEEGISFYAPEWREKIREVFSGCARFGTPYDEEMEIITATGERRWIRTTGKAVRDGDGRITGVQGALQDITERKEVEESWKEAYSQIEENMYKFSILNDEIRNPLAVIMALADLEGGEYADKIMEQIRAIDRIITLLDRGVLESESTRAFMRRHDQLSG